MVEMGSRVYPQVARDSLRSAVAQRAPWFTSDIDEVVWSLAVGFQRRLASPLGRDGVWLAGDAAHTALPLGMHSMNVGLLEAHQLAGRIATHVKGDAQAGSLEELAAERQRSLRFLLGVGESTVALAEASPWVRERRDRLVPCLPASGVDLDVLLRQIGLQRPK